jgi:hypothetical protein
MLLLFDLSDKHDLCPFRLAEDSDIIKYFSYKSE